MSPKLERELTTSEVHADLGVLGFDRQPSGLQCMSSSFDGRSGLGLRLRQLHQDPTALGLELVVLVDELQRAFEPRSRCLGGPTLGRLLAGRSRTFHRAGRVTAR